VLSLVIISSKIVLGSIFNAPAILLIPRYLDANTNFSITSEDKNGGLTIEAYSRPSFDSFINIMDFSTGELTFHSSSSNWT
jgi:hypothetical protein